MPTLLVKSITLWIYLTLCTRPTIWLPLLHEIPVAISQSPSTALHSGRLYTISRPTFFQRAILMDFKWKCNQAPPVGFSLRCDRRRGCWRLHSSTKHGLSDKWQRPNWISTIQRLKLHLKSANSCEWFSPHWWLILSSSGLNPDSPLKRKGGGFWNCSTTFFLPPRNFKGHNGVTIISLGLGFLTTNHFTEAPQPISKVFLYIAESMATDVPFPPALSSLEGGLGLRLSSSRGLATLHVPLVLMFTGWSSYVKCLIPRSFKVDLGARLLTSRTLRTTYKV